MTVKGTCGSCGSPVVPGDRFCGSCGALADQASSNTGAQTTVLPPIDAPPPPVTVDTAGGPRPAERRRSWVPLAIVVAFVLIAAGGAGVAVIAMGGGDDESAATVDADGSEPSAPTTVAERVATTVGDDDTPPATTAAPSTATAAVVPVLSVSSPGPVGPGETVYVNVGVDRPDVVWQLQLAVDGTIVDQKPVGMALRWISTNVEGSHSGSVSALGANGAVIATTPLLITVVLPTTVPPPTTIPPTVPPPPLSTTVPGDLGLFVAMTRPACDGQWAVFVSSAVTPGKYADEVTRALRRFPGSEYLRTDVTCSSLRPDLNGNPIYTVYYGPYQTKAEACAKRQEVLPLEKGAYPKVFDNVTAYDADIRC